MPSLYLPGGAWGIDLRRLGCGFGRRLMRIVVVCYLRPQLGACSTPFEIPSSFDDTFSCCPFVEKMINALAGLGWQPASHQVRSRRPSHESFRVEMGAEQSERSREIAAEYIRTSVDVTAAAAAGAVLTRMLFPLYLLMLTQLLATHSHTCSSTHSPAAVSSALEEDHPSPNPSLAQPYSPSPSPSPSPP